MFDAFVKVKRPIWAVLTNDVLIGEGEYLVTFTERTRNSQRTNGTFRGTNIVGTINNPKLFRAVPDEGTLVCGEEIVNHSFNIDEIARISLRAPEVETIMKGQEVVVTDDSILSYGTRGVVRGFEKGRNGNILAYIDYLEDGAPLRIGINRIGLWRPGKFWMIQPSHMNQSGNARTSFESPNYSGDGRITNQGDAVINNVYVREDLARRNAEALTRATGRPFVVMEVSSYVNSEGQVINYE